jgi:chromate reductase
MPNTIRILAFSGSARNESLNRKLLAVAVGASRAAGAEVTLLEPDDYTLPLYDGDLESVGGMPVKAAKLVSLALKHHALLIASPEYNSFITPLLKNTLDWMSRADEKPFAGKVAAVVSASPSALGGTRSQVLAKQLLIHLGCHVVPAYCTLSYAHEGFDADGRLKDSRVQKSVEDIVAQLIDTAKKLGRVS